VRVVLKGFSQNLEFGWEYIGKGAHSTSWFCILFYPSGRCFGRKREREREVSRKIDGLLLL
jgi:hypothetical protein